jgi:predicted secreted Zn-dependent protease
MIKITIFLILLMTFAAAISAASDNVQVANIDKDSQFRLMKPAISPIVTEKDEYYEVQGRNESELRCGMDHNSCKWDDGNRYDSVTSWRVKWDYGYDRTPQSCAAASFKTSVEVVIRYPKWVHDDGVPQALVSKWDNYIKNLTVHENGHRDMAVAEVADLSRAVAKLSPATNCSDVDREVQTLCRLRMKKLNADEKAYDVITKHGFTQGAIFP